MSVALPVKPERAFAGPVQRIARRGARWPVEVVGLSK